MGSLKRSLVVAIFVTVTWGVMDLVFVHWLGWLHWRIDLIETFCAAAAGAGIALTTYRSTSASTKEG